MTSQPCLVIESVSLLSPFTTPTFSSPATPTPSFCYHHRCCCASIPLSSTAMIARFSRLRRFFPSSFSFLAVLPPLLAIVIARRSFSFSSPAPPRSIRSDGVLSHLSFSLQRPASVFLKWLTVNFASWRACTRSHQAEDHVEPLSYAFAPDQCTGDLNEYKVREGITRYHSD